MRRGKFLFVRLNDHEHDVVREAADRRHMPVADYVRTLLRQATDTAPLASGGDGRQSPRAPSETPPRP